MPEDAQSLNAALPATPDDAVRYVFPVDLKFSGYEMLSMFAILSLLAFPIAGAGIGENLARDGSAAGALIGLGAGVVCCMGVLILRFVRKKRRAAALVRLLESQPELETSTILHAGSEGHMLAQKLTDDPKHLLRLIILARRPGTLIRVTPKKRELQFPVIPIDVLFEPVILDESDAEFEEWRLRFARQKDQKARSSGFLLRRWKRASRLVQASPLAVVVLLIVARIIGVILLMVILVIAFLPRSPRSRLWAFPGGIFWPKKRLVLRRLDSVIAWYPGLRKFHVASLHDRRVRRYVMTPLEAEFAMKAWCSEAVSPTDDMLATFFGD